MKIIQTAGSQVRDGTIPCKGDDHIFPVGGEWDMPAHQERCRCGAVQWGEGQLVPEASRDMGHAVYGDNLEYEAAGRALYEAGPGKASLSGWPSMSDEVKAAYRKDARIAVEAHNRSLTESAPKVTGG